MADARTVWIFQGHRLRRETTLSVNLDDREGLRRALANQVYLVSGGGNKDLTAGWRMTIMGPSGYPHVSARVWVSPRDGSTRVSRR